MLGPGEQIVASPLPVALPDMMLQRIDPLDGTGEIAGAPATGGAS